MLTIMDSSSNCGTWLRSLSCVTQKGKLMGQLYAVKNYASRHKFWSTDSGFHMQHLPINDAREAEAAAAAEPTTIVENVDAAEALVS
jgi:hypothetical protein